VIANSPVIVCPVAGADVPPVWDAAVSRPYLTEQGSLESKVQFGGLDNRRLASEQRP
jgi:hypothetical protein